MDVIKPVAAPLPSLPTKVDVQKEISEIDASLFDAKAELTSLQHQRSLYDSNLLVHAPEQAANSGLFEYHNILLSNTTIDSIISENQKKSNDSNSECIISDQYCDSNIYKRAYDFPLYDHTIKKMDQNCAIMLAIQTDRALACNEANKQLVSKYSALMSKNKKKDEALNAYHTRVERIQENWPPEMPKGSTKTEKDILLAWTAPDRPMILSPYKRKEELHFNNNLFIADPVAEHNAFKNRLVWTEEEKKKFLVKYAEHPKKFALIAASLPQKSVKDVIEYYWINRITLNLKDLEAAKKKRGGIKKVISEGSAKKNFDE